MTVIGVATPVSSSKTRVMPSFLPTIPFTRSLSKFDLDVDTRRQVEPHERVDRLRRGRVEVGQPLVRADLEVLARVLVLERAADHGEHVLLRRQRDGTGDGGAGSLGRLDDLRRRLVELLVVVALEPDADLRLRHALPAPLAIRL